MTPAVTVRRTDVLLAGDPQRVAARLFLPGQEAGAPGVSRAEGVVTRCSAIADDEVRTALATVHEQYGARHRDLDAVLDEHFDAIAHRVPAAKQLSRDRRRLLGAYFTRELSIEAAALCNPSLVVAPGPPAAPGSVRFVLSARAVSEGHLSTVVFRSGVFTPADGADGVVLDPLSRLVDCGQVHDVPVAREQLRRQATLEGAEPETLAFVLSRLPPDIDLAALDAAGEDLLRQALTRTEIAPTLEILRRTITGSYGVRFPDRAGLSERTLFPVAAGESHGMEDARFVRLTEDDGSTRYAATYTGYDGSHVACRRLDTDDFVAFTSTPLTGTAAENKGMALFPRQVGGRYLALSRWDRENNAVARSDDGYHWDDVSQLQLPTEPWELVQLGNCGPPIETAAGWLVLTHGVGPMRAYAMSAILLDLDDPTTVVGRLPEPLLAPAADERDGYVPNVVYSCGGLVHDDLLLLPYGCSDATIRMAVVDVPELLARLAG